MMLFWQTRSASRWSVCAGPPEVTYRSSASTSNVGGRSASLAAASCDPFLTPCGPEGRAKNRGCKLEIYLNTGWKRPLFDLWVDGGFWCTVFTRTLTSDPVILSRQLWILTGGYYAPVLFYVDNTIWTIPPDWCNKLPLRWINPKVLNRVGSILYSLQRLICYSHGQPCYFMVRFLCFWIQWLLQQYDLNKFQIFIFFSPWD